LEFRRVLFRSDKAGAAAIQIEDQSFPKRCGHMAGKRVVELSEAVGRIRAAVDAREGTRIVARTDALGIEGVEAALDRANAYLEAGADVIFVEGPRSWDEAQAIAKRFEGRAPLVHNLVEGGITPGEDAGAFFKLGYAATLHPLLLMHGLVG